MQLKEFPSVFHEWTREKIVMIQAGIDILQKSPDPATGVAQALRLVQNDFSEIAHKIILQDYPISSEAVVAYRAVQEVLEPNTSFLSEQAHCKVLETISMMLQRTDRLHEVRDINCLAALNAYDRKHKTQHATELRGLIVSFAEMMAMPTNEEAEVKPGAGAYLKRLQKKLNTPNWTPLSWIGAWRQLL